MNAPSTAAGFGSDMAAGPARSSSDDPNSTTGTPGAPVRSTYGFGRDRDGLDNTISTQRGPNRSSSPAVISPNNTPAPTLNPIAESGGQNDVLNAENMHGLFAMGLAFPEQDEAARIRTEKDEATAAQIRTLQQLLDQHKRHFDKMQNRLNTLHSELAAVTGKLKEQATKLSGPAKHALIQPQFDSGKAEKTNSVWFIRTSSNKQILRKDGLNCFLSQGSNGPSRAEFEIFCRACAENFAMIEVRLNELEGMLGMLQETLDNLQNQTHRLQHDKADENALMELLIPVSRQKLQPDFHIFDRGDKSIARFLFTESRYCSTRKQAGSTTVRRVCQRTTTKASRNQKLHEPTGIHTTFATDLRTNFHTWNLYRVTTLMTT